MPSSSYHPLHALLVEENPVTLDDINRRIWMGRPVFSRSPARAIVPLHLGSASGPLRLEAPPEQAPRRFDAAAPIPVKDNGTLYQQVQLALSTWAQATGACEPKDFGSRGDDFRGLADERTISAVSSFQRWANAAGATPALRTDGALDAATYVMVNRVAGDMVARHLASSPAVPAAARPAQPPASPMVPWWVLVVAAAGAAYVFREDLGL